MKREYWKYFPIIVPYVRHYWRLGLASIAVLVVSAALSLAQPWPLAYLVDAVLSKHHHSAGWVSLLPGTGGVNGLIVAVVVIGFLITFALSGLTVLSEYVGTKLDQLITLDFRSKMFEHCQRLSQAFHDNKTTGDFMYRINYEARNVGGLAVALPPLLQSALMLIGMFIVAARIDLELALVSLLVVPFIYGSIGYYGHRVEPRIIRVRNLEGRNLTIVNDAMNMLRVITAFNRQYFEYRRFRDQGETAVRARINVTIHQTLFSLAIAIITAAGSALVLGIGAHHVLSGRLSVGDLLVLMSYIGAIYVPLQTISSTISTFQQQLVGIRFATELLDTNPDIVERPHAHHLRRASGAIEFRHVQYRYPGRSPTLVDLDFSVAPGETIAIVGPTGAGKSTLVSLIPRFLDPDEGSVLLDNMDVRDLTLDSLREQVSFVQQEPLLFPRSIGENIRYGRLSATPGEVVEAAKCANAHDFISALPEGYRTQLGERGAKISGGERQRIALARAFLKNAPVLVLDEPTSSVDSGTEAAILEALERLAVGRTTLVVAHRLSTVRRASRIIVLTGGRIVEIGTPRELIALGGRFAALWRLQSIGAPSSGEPTVDVAPPGAAEAFAFEAGVPAGGRQR